MYFCMSTKYLELLGINVKQIPKIRKTCRDCDYNCTTFLLYKDDMSCNKSKTTIKAIGS